MSQMARSLGFLLMTVSMTSNYFHRKQNDNSTKNFLAVQLHVLESFRSEFTANL